MFLLLADKAYPATELVPLCGSVGAPAIRTSRNHSVSSDQRLELPAISYNRLSGESTTLHSCASSATGIPTFQRHTLWGATLAGLPFNINPGTHLLRSFLNV